MVLKSICYYFIGNLIFVNNHNLNSELHCMYSRLVLLWLEIFLTTRYVINIYLLRFTSVYVFIGKNILVYMNN